MTYRQLVLFDRPRDLRAGPAAGVPAAAGAGAGGRVPPVRPRARRPLRLGQGQDRSDPARHPDHARHPGHPRRADPPQRRRAADPDQALGRRGRRGARRGRDAGGRPRDRRRALVQRRGPPTCPSRCATSWASGSTIMRNGSVIAPRPAAAHRRHHPRPARLRPARPASVGRHARLAARDQPRRRARRPAAVRRARALHTCRACGRSSGSCKGRKLVFINPTFRIHVPAQAMAVPPAVDLAALRGALDSPDPARAVITALLAFHAMRIYQLARSSSPTSAAAGSASMTRSSSLADPSATASPHTWTTGPRPGRPRSTPTCSSTSATGKPPGRSPRVDRPAARHRRRAHPPGPHHQEAEATGGDIRALCDLFGMSIASAYRYTSVIDHVDAPTQPREPSWRDPISR